MRCLSFCTPQPCTIPTFKKHKIMFAMSAITKCSCRILTLPSFTLIYGKPYFYLKLKNQKKKMERMKKALLSSNFSLDNTGKDSENPTERRTFPQ